MQNATGGDEAVPLDHRDDDLYMVAADLISLFDRDRLSPTGRRQQFLIESTAQGPHA
jgi:hypothetical protein